MVWPILISLSVTPGAYFFCAAAGWASASARVSAGAQSNRFVVVIAFSLSKTCRAQGLSPAALSTATATFRDGGTPGSVSSCIEQPNGPTDADRRQRQPLRAGHRGAADFRDVQAAQTGSAGPSQASGPALAVYLFIASTSPKSSQVLPLNLASCSCWIG